jgi:hypothetical protein
MEGRAPASQREANSQFRRRRSSALHYKHARVTSARLFDWVARASRALATVSHRRGLFGNSRKSLKLSCEKEVRCSVTLQPTRETRALPGIILTL